MPPNSPPVVLAIAGFDPSAGAGVLADIKTMSAFGCYGIGVVTSLTIQNTRRFFGASHQSGEMIKNQLEPLFADFAIASVKTGMLPTAEVVEEVVAALSSNFVPHVVIDPVIRSTTGYDLIDEDALAALVERLFPFAAVVTPNWEESGRITGIAVRDAASAEQAARAILALGPRAVLVKGGDADGDNATDVLVDAAEAVSYRAPKMQSRNTHGTGCAMASALACLLARGSTLRESIPIAKEYIRRAIQSAPGLGSGNGPLNHFPPEWEV
ncbi:MAG TPA: bifunctional hydroxymethylpyrimidine kinase/phosphomethylpyrimidine kinase [Blastocatellia bacterium]|nr:bifunctional hydroxymethylpyrimidine kinase/phosphomethylpyrimidine kinase [Blastocatellia bacterium]